MARRDFLSDWMCFCCRIFSCARLKGGFFLGGNIEQAHGCGPLNRFDKLQGVDAVADKVNPFFYLTSQDGGPGGDPPGPGVRGGTEGGGENGGSSGFPGSSTGAPVGPDTYPNCPTV